MLNVRKGGPWSDNDRDEVLKRWNAGESAAEIGKRFGVSRSSVLSVVHRVRGASGESRETRDERGRRNGAMKGVIAKSVRSKAPPTLKAVPSLDADFTPAQIKGRKAGRASALAQTQLRPQTVSLKEVTVSDEHMAEAVAGLIDGLADALRVPEAGGTGGVSLMALRAGQCRGPKGEGRAGEPLFCGAPVRAVRQSYCESCHQALHAPKPQARQLDRSFTRQAVRHGW
ncbi:MAG: GcrA family cell cycle regulator [Asticcacaulis sp.]